MSRVELLDCTLRDGAYLIDKKFGDRIINGIIGGLVEAKIDYIEIGFFQDEGFGEGKTVYKNSDDAKRFVPKEKNGSRFTVLADYSRYTVDNLDKRCKDSIDAIRECFFKHERYDAIEACRKIKDKGYDLFVQPVDILGYTDKELIEFLELINEIEPYCISIVDTFGSMYQEDLHRIFEIINHNLVSTCKIGFHSHNNMQLSNALSQEFARMAVGKRDVVIDGTLSGMGRGAGNTPTELIAQYLVSKMGAVYDMDAILDLIDSFMDNMRARCSWGYSTEYFVAGAFGAHVNNITYLSKKNSIQSKDIRFILNKIGKDARKRYDYDLLEKTYLELMESQIDDTSAKDSIKNEIGDREVLILVPGRTVNDRAIDIKNYICNKEPVIISVNFLHKEIKSDFIYMSNVKRFLSWKNSSKFKDSKKIMTSNFSDNDYDGNTYIVSFANLVKCGWDAMDNSTVMLLRLLSEIGVKNVSIAGFDGYSTDTKERNYFSDSLEIHSIEINATERNEEIMEMLKDFDKTRRMDMNISFITPSRFENCLGGGTDKPLKIRVFRHAQYVEWFSTIPSEVAA